MNYLLVSCFAGLFIFVIAATVYLVIKQKDDVMTECQIREPKVTILLAMILWLEAIILLGICSVWPERLLKGANAYMNTAIFLLLSMVGGGFVIVYTLNKRFVIAEAGLIYRDVWGRSSLTKWQDITQVQPYGATKVSVLDRNGNRIDVRGEKQQLECLLIFLSAKVGMDQNGSIGKVNDEIRWD